MLYQAKIELMRRAGLGDWNISMMSNNIQWKMTRMQFHQVISVERVKQWRQKQAYTARMFALAMLDHPENFFKNIR
jgi:hypothetical protein